MGSFFGVTTLGPESVFESFSLASIATCFFTVEEFSVAFSKISGKSLKIKIEEIPMVFSRTFGFQPLSEEIELFNKMIANDKIEEISVDDFLIAVNRVKKVVQALRLKEKHYDSFNDLRDDRRRHRRAKDSPIEIFKAPLTTQQRIGWHDEEISSVRHPKLSCAETKYATALIKSGWVS